MSPPKFLSAIARALRSASLVGSLASLVTVATLASVGCGGPPALVGTIAGEQFTVADILSSKADAKTPVLRIVLSSATDVCRTKTQGGPLDGHQLLYLTVNTFGPNAMPAGPGMYNVSDTSVLNSRMGTEVEAVYAISSDTKTYRATSGLLTLTQVDALAIGGEASLNFATGEAVTIVFNRALRCAALLAQP